MQSIAGARLPNMAAVVNPIGGTGAAD